MTAPTSKEGRLLGQLPRFGSIADLVGQTPMLRLRSLEPPKKSVKIYLKLEYRNPGGSVKDRPAKQIFDDALADKRLKFGTTLIDATSGNTGVAYSMIGAAYGYPVKLVMPSNVSQARKDITQSYGTELIYSDPMEGSDGAIRKVRQIVSEDPDSYFYPDQYSNPSNPRSHEFGTAVEIWEQTGGSVTHFLAGLGTSGTCMGTTRGLKKRNQEVYCVAVEPNDAMHGLEGLKHMASSIVPEIFDPTLPDEILPMDTESGWDMADRLAEQEGLHVGHSTGANVAAAFQIAKRIEEGVIVTIACDRGDRYFAPMKWEKKYVW